MKVESLKTILRSPLTYILPIPAFAVFWLLFFYAYCFRVWVALGHTPTSIAEHGGLNGSWHHRAAWSLLGVLACVTPIWSIGVLLGLVFWRRMRRWWVVAALLVPWSIWLFVIVLDPGRWFAWFLD
jgi:hypothetical protein